MRQRATHITLKCSYSEHKWAVIKDRGELLGSTLHGIRAVSPPCYVVLTSRGPSGSFEVGLYCSTTGVSVRTGGEALVFGSCSPRSGATERPGFEPTGEVSDQT